MNNAFVIILGLVVGSFLNVVIFRLDSKKSFIFGRSFCFFCKKQINWYDNIPLISFLILKGQCRNCKEKISWQYPLVELATALIFIWLYLLFGLSFKFFALAVFSCFLLIIFVYDLKTYLILDRISIPAMIIAFLFNLYLGFGFWNLILAGLVGGGFFALQYFFSKGKWVGGGDIRLGAIMGLMLGFKFLFVALFIAYIIGGFVGIILIALRKKEMSSAVPFGPFLTAATFITFIYGQSILNWYLNLMYV